MWRMQKHVIVPRHQDSARGIIVGRCRYLVDMGTRVPPALARQKKWRSAQFLKWSRPKYNYSAADHSNLLRKVHNVGIHTPTARIKVFLYMMSKKPRTTGFRMRPNTQEIGWWQLFRSVLRCQQCCKERRPPDSEFQFPFSVGTTFIFGSYFE